MTTTSGSDTANGPRHGRLAGQRILVAGGAGGMGEAQAVHFAHEGAKVVVGDLDLDATARIAGGIGPDARSCRLDVTEQGDWNSALDLLEDSFGAPVTAMVNNAGIGGRPGDIVDTPPRRFLDVVTVNQFGAFLGIHCCAGRMLRAGGGSIVNVSSVLGLAGHRGVAPYVSSKFAVRGLTRVAAAELASGGVRVNCLCPGTVDTPMLRAGNTEADALDRLARQIPQGTVAQPSEVARAAVFLLSEDAAYITGTDLVVDGGLTSVLPINLAG